MKQAEATLQPKILIVGAGTTGRELVRRFAAAWPVSIVDVDRSRLDLIDVAEKDAGRVRKTLGDGTSRLVLEEAGIRKADYVITVASSDEINLEVCRIAREDFEKQNLYAAVQDFSQRERYKEADVDFVTPSYAAAVSLENRVLYGVGTSLMAAAEARGEVIEVSVLPSSPMIDRPLSSVRSRRWHVGAIYRGEELVVPTGPTRIEVDDRVILIGEKEILPSIGQFFRLGDPEFPLEFGANVSILTESSSDFEPIAEELRYLLDHSRARGVEILFWPHEPRIQNELDRICKEHGIQATASPVFGNYENVAVKHVVPKDCGFLIVPDERFRFLEQLGIRRTALSGIIRQMEAPIGILRGSHPYKKILVPVTHLDTSMQVARLAFDLTRIYRASVTIVTVTAPRFVVGAQAIEDQKAALGKMTHLANLYHLAVNEVHREGNPIQEVLKLCPDYNLMLLSHGKGRRPSFFNPDVSQHLFRRAPITTMILPR